MKKYTTIWIISLVIMAVTTLVWIASDIIKLSVPPMVTDICGVADIIAVAVFIFTSIKRRKE